MTLTAAINDNVKVQLSNVASSTGQWYDPNSPYIAPNYTPINPSPLLPQPPAWPQMNQAKSLSQRLVEALEQVERGNLDEAFAILGEVHEEISELRAQLQAADLLFGVVRARLEEIPGESDE